jgi:hypothetical protein
MSGNLRDKYNPSETTFGAIKMTDLIYPTYAQWQVLQDLGLVDTGDQNFILIDPSIAAKLKAMGEVPSQVAEYYVEGNANSKEFLVVIEPNIAFLEKCKEVSKDFLDDR